MLTKTVSSAKTSTSRLSLFLNFAIALIWMINGLYCKVLNIVPRHKEIVGGILGNNFAEEITVAIGIAETGMAIWIISGWQRKLVTWLQIAVILLMNMIEFLLVPHLLLFGRLNLLLAVLLSFAIWFNYYANKNLR